MCASKAGVGEIESDVVRGPEEFRGWRLLLRPGIIGIKEEREISNNLYSSKKVNGASIHRNAEAEARQLVCCRDRGRFEWGLIWI
jgi:hypothetical protein